MSVPVFEPGAVLVEQGELYGIGVMARVRNLVATLGGRFSLELGIELDAGAEEIERWALAATLFGNRISAAVAMRTYRVLESAGVRTIADAGGRSHEELVALLDRGGYVRYDERTASRLHALADAVSDRCGGRFATLGKQVTNRDELERALGALPGWGVVTVGAFLRELRGVWPGADPTLDVRAVDGARHLDLPPEPDALRSVATAAHLDFRDLETGLLRLERSHDLTRCPGSDECRVVGSERTRLVQF